MKRPDLYIPPGLTARKITFLQRLHEQYGIGQVFTCPNLAECNDLARLGYLEKRGRLGFFLTERALTEVIAPNN